MTHKHTWKRDYTRKHGDAKRGRFFVICTDPTCKAKAQATMQSGFLHVFRTNRYRGGSKVISMRVSDDQYKIYLKDKKGFEARAKALLKKPE